MMTCRQRIMAIRMMEEMERMNSNRVKKENDGTLKYQMEDGTELVSIKMVRKEA